MKGNESWLNKINWPEDGIIPAVTQEAETGRLLMLGWMNHASLKKTLETGEAVYWSRARKKLWRKGEESGHVQKIAEIRLDCDNDAILLVVEQTGGIACHTGRHSCFFQKLDDGNWIVVDPVLKEPSEIYRK